MQRLEKIVWLEGIFNEETVVSARAVSPAANYWQLQFIRALLNKNISVDVLGYMPEPLWPRGKLCIGSKDAGLPKNIHGKLINYINFPILRNYNISEAYLKSVKTLVGLGEKISSVVTFNDSPANKAALYLQKKFNIPWICIVADGEAPHGADGYLYLTWGYYKSTDNLGHKIHIDGGVPCVNLADTIRGNKTDEYAKIIMYMGSMSAHGGVEFLARSFSLLKDSNVELWLCGKGVNHNLRLLAKKDKRIKLKGYVDEIELNHLANKATVFVNPRPTQFAANQLNFPSKILKYLSYGKPVITTMSNGMSPEYANVCVVLEDETEKCLAATISRVIFLEKNKLIEISAKVEGFAKTHRWTDQAEKFIAWINQDLIDV